VKFERRKLNVLDVLVVETFFGDDEILRGLFLSNWSEDRAASKICPVTV
jgi:hypothetical protein